MTGDPREHGLFPLDLVLLPGEARALHIFEPRYRQLFADCVLGAAPFVVVREHDGARADVGCAAEFERLVQRAEDGRVVVVVRGLGAARVGEAVGGRLYDAARCIPLVDDPGSPDPARAAAVVDAFRAVAEAATGAPRDPRAEAGVPLSYAAAGAVELPGDVLQALLGCRDENERLGMVRDALAATVEGLGEARAAAARASTNGAGPHP